MVIDFFRFTESLSVALDYAEKELLDVKPFHGARVAVIANKLAENMDFGKDVREALTQAALLHDCALSEYFSDEMNKDGQTITETEMAAHCVAGERMIQKLPFYKQVEGAVLYHHERADGRGALGKYPEETPICAQLIHMADAADVLFSLYTCDRDKYQKLREWVMENAGAVFTEECGRTFLDSIDYDLLQSISGDNVKAVLERLLPRERMTDVSVETLREMASVFAEITDYKSHFTWRHSMGIAEKAEKMGEFYMLSDEECGQLYIAGALHDIGKLLISNSILEKPGKLSPEEYREIQNHAVGTWEMLSNITGMEDITLWAALHHEKLDGSGYPFGYTKEKLDRNSRLMACLDIYQALVEDRPYKEGMSHIDAMVILRKMKDAGQLDGTIIDDIDKCFANETSNNEHSVAEKPEYTGGVTAYRCPVCGYVLEGERPDDFICPRCEQPGSIFEKIT